MPNHELISVDDERFAVYFIVLEHTVDSPLFFLLVGNKRLLDGYNIISFELVVGHGPQCSHAICDHHKRAMHSIALPLG